MTIIERSRLSFDDISALIRGEVTAIRVPKYFSEEQSASISAGLISSRLHGKYENAPEIGRVGQAFFESNASDASAKRYETYALDWVHEMRERFSPYITPIDRVRLEFDELWPMGATIATMNGRKMFVGLARTFSTGSSAEPHQDIFSWDAPDSSEAKEVTTQIAMNVYLSPAEVGGELALWSFAFDKDNYASRQNPGSYGLRRDQLPNPAAIIAPRVGELILFKANNVHSVEEIRCGTRVTWSCFIGFRGYDKSLVMWS